MQRLGILGGTFDPIHEGHTRLAQQAVAQGLVDQAVLVPMGHPIHRNPVAPAETRLRLCREAVENIPNVTVSEAGMASGVRYTADTLPLLAKEFPNAQLVLLLGADKLKSLPDWYQAEQIFSRCEILCFPRSGIETEKAVRDVREYGARIRLMEVEETPYSSERIRRQTAKYQDAPGLNRKVLCDMAVNGLYQTDFLPKLKLMMNPRRFRHTLGVREEAVRLADKHGVPIQKAALAALLHDCAKGMSQKDMEKIARKHHLMQDESMLESGAMMHGPVGAYLAKKQFGIQDEEVLDAIRSHTIGRPGMTMLELCIFVADATEPNREEYDGLHDIRALAEVSLPAAALKSMQLTQEFLYRTNRPFYPVVLDAMKYLEAMLSDDEKKLMYAYQ